MNDELIKDKIETHEKRINNHSDRIDKLEREGAELKVEIKNLCENLRSLTSVIKWFITVFVGAFISFFFYAVQQNIFK